MKASEYFKQDYGRRFTGATLYGKGGILELSMKDIYDLMEGFHQAKVNAVTDKDIRITGWNETIPMAVKNKTFIAGVKWVKEQLLK